MGIDFDKIAAENRKYYGTRIDHYGPVLLAHLYSDQTHFIFELLQNAEDEGASEIDFRLFPDRLEVHHNGRPFDEDDVRGICGLVAGTKSEDIAKIGRFGIGFKSVFAYTNSPEIHSLEHHFRIKDYVIPESIARTSGNEDTTVFVFPFDHREVTETDAYDQIEERLEALGLRTLLFLRNINAIRWYIANELQGQYRRMTRQRKFARTVTLRSKIIGEKEEERWLVFSKSVQPPDSTSTGAEIYVEIAYSLESDESGNELLSPIAESSPLAVFFETDKETNLGFLIQGPYVTTPARDNVPEKNEWNVGLVTETATLVVASLRQPKEMGLLSVSVLNCMPLRETDFHCESMFYPIFDGVRRAIATEDFIPIRGNGHVSGKNAVLARDADMVSMFNPRRLKEILALDTTPKWLSTEITQYKTPALYDYLVPVAESVWRIFA